MLLSSWRYSFENGLITSISWISRGESTSFNSVWILPSCVVDVSNRKHSAPKLSFFRSYTQIDSNFLYGLIYLSQYSHPSLRPLFFINFTHQIIWLSLFSKDLMFPEMQIVSWTFLANENIFSWLGIFYFRFQISSGIVIKIIYVHHEIFLSFILISEIYTKVDSFQQLYP